MKLRTRYQISVALGASSASGGPNESLRVVDAAAVLLRQFALFVVAHGSERTPRRTFSQLRQSLVDEASDGVGGMDASDAAIRGISPPLEQTFALKSVHDAANSGVAKPTMRLNS